MKPNGYAGPNGSSSASPIPPAPVPLRPDERPPIDPDAT